MGLKPDRPLAVQVITDLHRGGAQRQCALLARELTGLGWRVALVVLDEGPLVDVLRSPVPGTSELPRVLRLPAAGHRDPLLPVHLYRVLSRLRPTIVQTWLPLMDVMAGMAARGLGVPWILSERNSAADYQGLLSCRLRRHMGLRALKIVANSHEGAAYWHRQGVPLDRLRVIANAVEMPLEDVRPQRLADDAPLQVLVVARLEPQKRVDVILRAVATLQAEGQRVVVRLCGAGGQDAALRAQAAALGISASCRFLGVRADVESLMDATDVLVSASAYEGEPNAVLEAIARRCPVVLSDIPVHRRLCGDEHPGLFTPGDEHALARAIVLCAGQALPVTRLFGRGPAQVARRYADLYWACVCRGRAERSCVAESL